MDENKKLKESLSKINFLAFNAVNKMKKLKLHIKKDGDAHDAAFDDLIKNFENIEKLSSVS
jgi:hypothetical protein